MNTKQISKNAFHVAGLPIIVALIIGAVGCHTKKAAEKRDSFFTSGSREADQRASQRMARDEQIKGTGEGTGEKNVKEAKTDRNSAGAPGSETNRAAQAEGKLTLFDRLGGQTGISNIVADFVPRALQDPRVNWQRRDVKRARGFFHRDRDTVAWEDTPEHIAVLKDHLVQFLSLATGGPAHYDGKTMKSTHDGMNINNPEFDAAIGDLKASLDKLQIPNKEQKELLAIIESTRPQVVTKK